MTEDISRDEGPLPETKSFRRIGLNLIGRGDGQPSAEDQAQATNLFMTLLEEARQNPQAGTMENVVSLTGATAGQESSSVWCIPSVRSPTMPICVLTMTREGPRYSPTGVMAPLKLRPRKGDYQEIAWNKDDRDLMDAVWTWQMSLAALDGKPEPDRIIETTVISTDVAAVARFVDGKAVKGKPASVPVGEALFLGRSISFELEDATLPQTGWIVSDPYDDGTVSVVVRHAAGQYGHLYLPVRALGEDGNADRLLKALEDY